MFTRCPKCKEVHPLTAGVLSRSTGLVQCGKCDRIFNALSFLSDDWHASQTFKPAENTGTELPVLGGRNRRNVRQAVTNPAVGPPATTAETRDVVDGTESPADFSSIDQSQAHCDALTDRLLGKSKAGRSHGWLWGLGTAVLLLVTLANAAWTFQDHWLKQPVVHQWALKQGWIEPDKPQGMFTKPSDIQLVSRDMHTHPTRTGILVLSITFVNLAQQTQAFPVLRITLLDAGNLPIAQRRLQPVEYLRIGADIDAGLRPDVFLPILLELADPGEPAVGFKIEFL